MKTFIGIEIGGTKLQIVSGDDHARIIDRYRFEIHPAEGAIAIREKIQETISKIRSTHEITAIGVGFGGPTDHTKGKIWTSYHVSGWSGFELAPWLKEISGSGVSVDNDANVAGLGEATHGAGKNNTIVFYVTLGSGVGGGLVINKKIYHGVLPGEMEIGHVRLDKSGRIIQSSCSGWAVDEKIRSVVSKYPEGRLASLTKGYTRGEAKVLTEAIRLGDTHASNILEETADDLAFGLSHVVQLIHPETIILGGGLSLIGEPLRKLVEQKLTPYIMDALRPGPDIRLAALKEDAVPVGALSLAIQQFNQ